MGTFGNPDTGCISTKPWDLHPLVISEEWQKHWNKNRKTVVEEDLVIFTPNNALCTVNEVSICSAKCALWKSENIHHDNGRTILLFNNPHSAEISGFFCYYSDFTWNQFWCKSRVLETAILTILEALNFCRLNKIHSPNNDTKRQFYNFYIDSP